MSKLFDVLSEIVTRVNNSIKKTPQSLTDEEKSQVRDNIGAGSPQVQSDWSENDSTLSSYVKGRTHFLEESVGYEYFSGQVTNGHVIRNYPLYIEENIVGVQVDDVVYRINNNGDDQISIEDVLSVAWTQLTDGEALVLTLYNIESCYLKIYGIIQTYHKIDGKYLPEITGDMLPKIPESKIPDTIARSSKVVKSINGMTGNVSVLQFPKSLNWMTDLSYHPFPFKIDGTNFKTYIDGYHLNWDGDLTVPNYSEIIPDSSDISRYYCVCSDSILRRCTSIEVKSSTEKVFYFEGDLSLTFNSGGEYQYFTCSKHGLWYFFYCESLDLSPLWDCLIPSNIARVSDISGAVLSDDESTQLLSMLE